MDSLSMIAGFVFNACELKRALVEHALWWHHMMLFGPNLSKICSHFEKIACSSKYCLVIISVMAILWRVWYLHRIKNTPLFLTVDYINNLYLIFSILNFSNLPMLDMATSCVCLLTKAWNITITIVNLTPKLLLYTNSIRQTYIYMLSKVR